MERKKLLNFPKLIKRLYIILWLVLVILLILKYCFNIWYPIIINNSLIINICNYIDNTFILKYFIMLLFYMFSSNIIFLTLLKSLKYKNKKNAILFNCLFLLGFLLKFIHNAFGILMECLLLVISIIHNIKLKTYKNIYLNILIPITIYLLINVWQLNIYLIRDFNIELLKDIPSLLSYVLMLDYYIFLIIMLLEVKYMSLFSWGWLFAKEVTELKALRAKELNKKNPNEKLINKIDEVIKSKENE